MALADGLRLEATEAIHQLKQAGLKQLVMLTGDRSAIAKHIAQQVNITEYRAELLPEDKLTEIQQLRRIGVVGMVGDGINDAPALTAADISFAVGGIDIALETFYRTTCLNCPYFNFVPYLMRRGFIPHGVRGFLLPLTRTMSPFPPHMVSLRVFWVR